MTTATTAGFPAFRDNRFLQGICIAGFVALLIAAYHPDQMFDFVLENGTMSIFVVLLICTYRVLPFSDLSYLLLFLFFCLHEWGAHYKYTDVPLGEWMKTWLHTNRNHYDRVAHFAFGLLIAYPVQEITIAGNLKDMFQSVVAVGNDVSRRGSRQCGSILLERMTIAGD